MRILLNIWFCLSKLYASGFYYFSVFFVIPGAFYAYTYQIKIQAYGNTTNNAQNMIRWFQVMRVNSANVLDEGLKIGERGRRMNLKVKDQTN
jgi:hypothetical protein